MSDTLALANGIIIDTSTGQAIVPEVGPDVAIANDKRQSAKKRLEAGRDRYNKAIRIAMSELPADPKAVTSCGVVWLYFMLGLSDVEIAACTGMRVDQVDMIKGLKLFNELDSLIMENMGKLRHDDVANRIDAATSRAFDTLEELLDSEEASPSTRARIASNILDRGGHSPKQIIENRHMMAGGLTIHVIKETAMPKNMPTIHIDRSNITDITEDK